MHHGLSDARRHGAQFHLHRHQRSQLFLAADLRGLVCALGELVEVRSHFRQFPRQGADRGGVGAGGRRLLQVGEQHRAREVRNLHSAARRAALERLLFGIRHPYAEELARALPVSFFLARCGFFRREIEALGEGSPVAPSAGFSGRRFGAAVGGPVLFAQTDARIGFRAASQPASRLER